MRYILNALQKLSALDLVPSKVGGCFPLKLVLSSTGVVIVAWAITGGADADMVVACAWRGIGVWMTGGTCNCGVAIGDDCNVGLVVVPCSRLWIPSLKVVPAWSGSPMGWMGGGTVDGPGSSAGGSPLCNPP